MRTAIVTTGLLGLAGSAAGQFLGAPLTITVSNAQGSTTQVVNLSDGNVLPGGFLWSGDYELRDDNTNELLALFTQGSLRVTDNALIPQFPSQVAFGFNVVAVGSDTTVTIETGEFDLVDMPNQIVRATSSITLTDLDEDGASMVGAFGDGSMYQSFINGSLQTSALHSSLMVGPGGQAPVGETATDPLSGIPIGGSGEPFEPIPGVVSSFSSRISFTVSEGDSANGTNSFFIVPVPTPSVVTVMGAGLLVAGRRGGKR